MKIGIFSDLHLHKWTYGNGRMAYQHAFLNAFIKHCADEKVEAAVCCGDFFHRRGAIDPSVALVSAMFCHDMKQLHIPLFILPGNHDSSDRGGVSSLSFLKEVGAIIPDDKNPTFILGDALLGFIPFKSKQTDFQHALSRVDEHDPTVLFIHQGIKGCDMGSGFLLDEFLTPEMLPPDVMTFAGHYHIQKQVTPDLVIVGPPMQHNWGDKNLTEPGWIIYDTSARNYYERIPWKESPQFKEIEYKEVMMHVVADLTFLKTFLKNNIVRVLNCPRDIDPTIHKLLMENGANYVEIQIEKETKQYEALVSEGVDVDDVLKQITSSMSDREKKVGNDLIQGSYEVY